MIYNNNEAIIEKVESVTKEHLVAWKNARGYAPVDVANKIDKIMIDWIISLTEYLKIWDKNIGNLTIGEIILARTNLGTLVECWLKFFLVIHLDNYKSQPIIDKKEKVIKPEKLSFEQLRIYYKENIFVHSDIKYNDWIESIQHKRNGIHAFNYKDLGTNKELHSDFFVYLEFIEHLIDSMPDNPNEFSSNF